MFEKVICATEWDGCWFCSKCYSMHHYTQEAYRPIGSNLKLCENCKNLLTNTVNNAITVSKKRGDNNEIFFN